MPRRTSIIRRPVVFAALTGVVASVLFVGLEPAGRVWGRFIHHQDRFAEGPPVPSDAVLALFHAGDPVFTVGPATVRTAIIGAHSLEFRGTDDEATNVALCVRQLDGFVVPAGGEFSFNEAVGERTEERGFRQGLIYESGTLVTGVGGGVCIPATAVYVAALRADMAIVERWNHSGPVHYAEPGLDAAVAFGHKDMRFRNTSPFPVTIHATLMGNFLTVQIEGVPALGRRVVLDRIGFTTLPPVDALVDDESVPLGQRTVKSEGRSGYTVSVVRSVFQGTKLLIREEVSKDTVAPLDRVLTVNPLDDPASPAAFEAALTAAPDEGSVPKVKAAAMTVEPRAEPVLETATKPAAKIVLPSDAPTTPARLPVELGTAPHVVTPPADSVPGVTAAPAG